MPTTLSSSPAGSTTPDAVRHGPGRSGLRALYINCPLKKRPEPSHTRRLIDAGAAIMRRHVHGSTAFEAAPQDPLSWRIGSRTRSVVPLESDSMVISPECRSTTIRREMSRPSPVPLPTSLVV